MTEDELTMNARRKLWGIERIANRVAGIISAVLFVKMYWFPDQAPAPDDAQFWPCLILSLVAYAIVFATVRQLSLPNRRNNQALDRIKDSLRPQN
jgi:hypothetical protein